MMIEPDFKILAFQQLVGEDKSFKITGALQFESAQDSSKPTNVECIGNTFTFPTKGEIEQKEQELRNQWISAEYQRLRQPEYPPLSDLADALYWQQQGDDTKMTAYLAAVQAVKDKYPKE